MLGALAPAASLFISLCGLAAVLASLRRKGLLSRRYAGALGVCFLLGAAAGAALVGWLLTQKTLL